MDVTNDAEASSKNFEIMAAAGVMPLPIYHLQSPIEELERIINKYDPVVVGIGGFLMTPRAERGPLLRQVFDRYAGRVLFHGFGVADRNLCGYPFFSADTASWIISPRGFRKILTPKGYEVMPGHWSGEQGMYMSASYLVSLETS